MAIPVLPSQANPAAVAALARTRPVPNANANAAAFRSHLPKGVSLSPSGDIGAKREKEGNAFGTGKIKKNGKGYENKLKRK